MSKIKLNQLLVAETEVKLEQQKATFGGTCAVGPDYQPIGNCVDYGKLMIDNARKYFLRKQEQQNNWYDYNYFY